MEKEYYIVEGDSRIGPLTLSQLTAKGIEPSTLVWTAGMADWTRADCVPELSPLLASQTRVDESESAFGAYARPEQPYKDTPYGRNGGYNQPYQQRQNAYYGNRGGDNQGYGQYQSAVNWKTLAIVATIAGFLFSCIGGILGIFAILAANKAENATAYGDDITARTGWSNCKTLTIISFVLTGIGLVANIVVISNIAKLGLATL